MRTSLWIRAGLAAALLEASPALGALAAEGGNCPWTQDIVLDFGDGRTLSVPQAIFNPRNPDSTIGSYEMRPDLEALTLTIRGPYGQVWQAALTRITGGKRCTAFYAGRPTRVEEDAPANRVAER